MTTAELLADLTRRGVRLEARGDRIRYSPRSAVTPGLAEHMKAHKPELLAILRGQDTCRDPICCWCHSDRLTERPSGLWCDNCGKLVWYRNGPHGAIRTDYIVKWIEPDFDLMRPWSTPIPYVDAWDVGRAKRSKRQIGELARQRHETGLCPRCGGDTFTDVVLEDAPHNGETIRRDCAQCNKFVRWVRWYGSEPSEN